MKKTLLLTLLILLAGCTQQNPAQDSNAQNQTINIQNNTKNTTLEKNDTTIINETLPAQTRQVEWQSNGEEWTPNTKPPECTNELNLTMPANINLATAILYPGQVRGNDFKPHGGFRFDNSNNSITVKAPITAYLDSASRYTENGQTQYLFEMITDCGISYRFDHLLTLTPKLQTIADKLPQPKEGDSRTTKTGKILIEKEETLATAIGVPGNVFFDFGLYDLRQKNGVVIQEEDALASYGLCWLNHLQEPDRTTAKNLPGGDSINGKTSEYC